MKSKYLKRNLSQGRQFLNSEVKKLTAWVIWEADISECHNNFVCGSCRDKNLCNKNRLKKIIANIKIKDCSSDIKLDFDIDGDTSETDRFIKNDIKKINILLRELKKFKKEYLKKINILNDNLEHLENVEKKKNKRNKKL